MIQTHFPYNGYVESLESCLVKNDSWKSQIPVFRSRVMYNVLQDDTEV